MAQAVLWGRNVYQSIRKFLQFQLVVNVVAVSLNLIAACAGIKELPLAAVPLLWVNMITDSMGALALATEPPSDRLMDRQPFGRTAPLVNKQMWRNIIGVSTYQLIVCITLMFAGTSIMGIECPIIDDHEDCHHRTLELNGFIFNAFVFMQVFSEVNSRRISDFNVFEDIHKSGLFCTIILLTVDIQVLFIEVVGSTVVGPAIGFVNLTTKEWITSIVLGVIILPVGALTRWRTAFALPGRHGRRSHGVSRRRNAQSAVGGKSARGFRKSDGSFSGRATTCSPSRAESPVTTIGESRSTPSPPPSPTRSKPPRPSSPPVALSQRRQKPPLFIPRILPLSRRHPSSLRNRHPSFRRAATMVISANRFRLPTMDTIRDDIDDDEENAIKKMKK